MIRKIAFSALLLAALETTAPLASTPGGTENEASKWVIEGNNTVLASQQLLARLTRGPMGKDKEGSTVFVSWPDAQMTTEGRPPLRVRLEITMTAGRTMPVGTNTPYPGLITKLTDARGTLVNLATGYTAVLLLSEQESWIGRFIHSSSAGSNHLAVEVPFSLHDAKTGLLIAASDLLVRIDLADPNAPKARRVLVSPTPTADLRLQSPDIGRAMTGQVSLARKPTMLQPEIYEAAVSQSNVAGVAGRNQFIDLFSLESLDLYQCDTGEWMELGLESAGFTRAGKLRTAPLSLRLRYMPALIDTEGQVAYLDQLSGVLTFHHGGETVHLQIGPGNHGKVASRAYRRAGDVQLDLGIALRDGSSPPTLAHLVISCRMADSTCESIQLVTASDETGPIASSRALSAQLENTRARARVGDPVPLGGPDPCPGLCPVCLTGGCVQHDGFCTEAGAPIGCTSGCPHAQGTTQCCRGGTSKLCCVARCGVPDH